MRSLASLLVLTLSLCVLRSARAQQSSVQAEAEEEFRKARAAQDHGDCKLALELLHKSQDLVPGRGKLLNIAICEEQIGRLATAMHQFQEILPKFSDDSARAKLVKTHIDALAPRLPYLRIDLDQTNGSTSGVTVSYDDAPLAPTLLGVERPVDPGKHMITVSTPGQSERRYPVTIEEAKKTVIALELGAVVNDDSHGSQTNPPGEKVVIEVLGQRRSVVPGVIMGVAALGAVGAGAGLFVASNNKRDQTYDLANNQIKTQGACTTQPIDKRCDQVKSLAKQSDTLHNSAIGVFIGGGALAIGTLTYLLLPPPKVKKTVIESGRLHVTPILGTSQGGVIVSGAF